MEKNTNIINKNKNKNKNNNKKRNKCSFCKQMRITYKFDLKNNITREEANNNKTVPYLYELKFSYDTCKKCRKMTSML